MTNDQQTAHWYKFHRFQQRQENIFTPKMKAALNKQINDYIESGTVHAVSSEPVYKVLYEIYTTIPHIWAATSTVEIRRLKARMPLGFSQRIIDLMKQYFDIDIMNLAETITDNTKRLIIDVLSKMAQNGFGYDWAVKQLTSANFHPGRARLIVRTESTAAANAASSIAAKDTGLVMDKIWISARDKRTRRTPRDEFDHYYVNGQVVPMDEPFKITGESLMFPGDKTNSSLGNRINCRCTHAFIPKRDTNGRLIRKELKFNPYHRPAGDEHGGEFTTAPIGSQSNQPEQEISHAVAVYQSTLFDAINNELRYDKPDKYKDIIKLLDKASIDTTEDNLFRGLKSIYTNEIIRKAGVVDATNIEELNEKLVGKVLSDKAFMSTSRDGKIAADFAGANGSIMAIAGQKKGIEVTKHVNNYRSRKEREFLIKRNSKVRITKVSISKTGKIIFYTEIL